MDPSRWPHVGQTYGLEEHAFMPGLTLPPGGLPAPVAPSVSSLSPLSGAGLHAHLPQQMMEHMPPLSGGNIAVSNPYKSVIVGQPAYTLNESPTRPHLSQQTEPRNWGLSNFLPSGDRQELPRSTAGLQRSIQSQPDSHISHCDIGYMQQVSSTPKTDVRFVRQVPQSDAQDFTKQEGRFTDHTSVTTGYAVDQQTRVYPHAQPKQAERIIPQTNKYEYSRSFEESSRNIMNFDHNPNFNSPKAHEDSPQHHCSSVTVSQPVHPDVAHPTYHPAPVISPTKTGPSKEYFSPPREKEEMMTSVNFQPYQEANPNHPSLNTLSQSQQDYRMQQALQQDNREQKPFNMGITDTVQGTGRIEAEQAAADSTTAHPKKARRKRKSKEAAKPVVVDQDSTAQQVDIDASYRLVEEANAMLSEPIVGSMLQELNSSTVTPFDSTSPSSIERGRIYGGGPVHKTKAEQKQVSVPAISAIDEDDEFAVFASPPDPKAKATETVNCKKEKDEKNFQVSYLQFIQGKKQETLTSVTNTTITEKPAMPKYIPEPPRASKPQVKQEEIVRKSEFSDDEDSTIHEANIDEAVKNIISDLESSEKLKSEKTCADLKVSLKSGEVGISKSVGAGSSTSKTPAVVTEHEDKLVDSSEVSEPIDKTVTGQTKGRNTAKRGRGSGRGVKRGTPDDDGQQEVDSPAPVSEAEEAPVRRSTPRRAAKTVGQEKMQKGNAKKTNTGRRAGARKKRRLTDLSSDSEEEAATSDAEFAPPSTESESADEPDSDNDPAWTPFEQKSTALAAKVDSDDEMMDSASRRGRKKISVRGRGRGRGRPPAEYKSVESPIPYATTPASNLSGDNGTTTSTTITTTSKPTNTVRPIVISVEEPEEDSDGEIPAHKYIKGEFVIDKKDMENVDSFPLWKIYSTSLIQKFEPIQHNDRLCHKVTMLYANWSNKYKKKYAAVKVKYHNHAKNQDVVEVLPEYMPRPPFDPKLEEHEMMIPFNILIQTLVSQSLEEGFLKIVMETKDSYYIDAFEKIEEKLSEGKMKLQNPHKFIRTYEAALQKYPKLEEEITIGQMQGCKALQSTNERATRLMKLSGPDYDRDTLVVKEREGAQFQEFMVSMKAAQLSKVYHHLHHYRLQLLETCKKKVSRHKQKEPDVESKGILDKCLQDRVWIQKLFWQMNYLLREAGVIIVPS